MIVSFLSFFEHKLITCQLCHSTGTLSRVNSIYLIKLTSNINPQYRSLKRRKSPLKLQQQQNTTSTTHMWPCAQTHSFSLNHTHSHNRVFEINSIKKNHRRPFSLTISSNNYKWIDRIVNDVLSLSDNDVSNLCVSNYIILNIKVHFFITNISEQRRMLNRSINLYDSWFKKLHSMVDRETKIIVNRNWTLHDCFVLNSFVTYKASYQNLFYACVGPVEWWIKK